MLNNLLIDKFKKIHRKDMEEDNLALTDQTISDDDRIISFPKNEESINLANELIREIIPVDSDGEIACILKEQHGYNMINIIERVIKQIKEKINNESFISIFNLLNGLIFAISYEDYWTQIDNYNLVYKICKKMTGLLDKVLNVHLIKNLEFLTKEEKIRIMEFIKECSKYCIKYQDEGIKTCVFECDETMKMLTQSINMHIGTTLESHAELRDQIYLKLNNSLLNNDNYNKNYYNS